MLSGACAHYVVSKFRWKPFWLATQRDTQNDWAANQTRVNYDVFAQAPFKCSHVESLQSLQNQSCRQSFCASPSLTSAHHESIFRHSALYLYSSSCSGNRVKQAFVLWMSFAYIRYPYHTEKMAENGHPALVAVQAAILCHSFLCPRLG